MNHDLRTPFSTRLPARQHRPVAGFSLIELMIVVAIIMILVAIAWPSYRKHVLKTHRVAAEACLSEYANYMERYYTTYLRYDKDPASGTANPMPTLDCKGQEQTGNFYNYVPTSSATAFKIEAQPIDGQKSDTTCGTLSINQAGTRTADGTTPTQCW